MMRARLRPAIAIEPVGMQHAERLTIFARAIYYEDAPTHAYTTAIAPPSLEKVSKAIGSRRSGFVALEDGKIVGEAYAKSSEEMSKATAEIVYTVAKELRGTGIAYELVHALLEDLEKHGVDMIAAVVFEQNLASIAFMKKLGAWIVPMRKAHHDERRGTDHKLFICTARLPKMKAALEELIASRESLLRK